MYFERSTISFVFCMPNAINLGIFNHMVLGDIIISL